jgi:hypothetical protein
MGPSYITRKRLIKVGTHRQPKDKSDFAKEELQSPFGNRIAIHLPTNKPTDSLQRMTK